MPQTKPIGCLTRLFDIQRSLDFAIQREKEWDLIKPKEEEEEEEVAEETPAAEGGEPAASDEESE